MDEKRDDKNVLRHVNGTFAEDKKPEQVKTVLAPVGVTGTRRRSVEELGIHPSILMAPCSQQETYQDLHRAFEPYRRTLDTIEYAAKAKAKGDTAEVERLMKWTSTKEDAMETAGDFFSETFKILTPDEIAPYWERASRAIEDKDDFEFRRALLDASMAEQDAHPIRLDPSWRRPGVHFEEGFYESPKVVGDKQGQLADYNVATINIQVRKDIHEAKKAGWLPADLDVKVRKQDGGGAITMLVTSIPAELQTVPHQNDELAAQGWKAPSPAAKEIDSRLTQIAQQYGTFENDTQQDYFSNSYFVFVNFK